MVSNGQRRFSRAGQAGETPPSLSRGNFHIDIFFRLCCAPPRMVMARIAEPAADVCL